MITAERCSELKPYQRINHFPGMGEIARKDCLARNLQKMQKSYSEEYDFFPRTWNLPSDYTSLTNYYHELKKRKKLKTFITKPANGAMGNGINLIQNLDKISMHDHMVVQEYLDRPLLIDEMKFDLRIYVLVWSCDPLKIFIYDDGLMRLSTQEYEPPSEKNLSDVYMHLTNYSINKSNDNYEFNDDEDKGSKRTIKYLRNWMISNGYNFNTLWTRICDIVTKTIIVAEPYLLHAYRMARPGTTATSTESVCFEVLGMDIFVDRKLRPWLLEVNRSPSFGCETKVDNDIKYDLIKTAFQLLNLKPCEKKRSMVAQKELSRARLLKPRRDTQAHKSQFLIRKSYLKNQLNELRRLSDQSTFEDNNCGHYQRIFPTKGTKQEEYVNLLNGAFRTFLAGRGSLLEQDSHQGMLQHLRESELLDMLQQCESEELTSQIDAQTKANRLKNLRPLSKLRPYSSPPISPSVFSRHVTSPHSQLRWVNGSSNGSPLVPNEDSNYMLRAAQEREDQLNRKTLTALNEMRIKFPGKDGSETERLLKELQVSVNWKYHKPRIASYWLVKLDSVKRKKLIDIVRDSVCTIISRIWVCKGNVDERLFVRVYNRMLWSHGQGLWNCFSSIGASWEMIFSKGGDPISALELNCCRRVVQLCKECLQIVYIYSAEVNFPETGSLCVLPRQSMGSLQGVPLWRNSITASR